jgi:outer membrane protein assembly factor BamB
VKQLIHWLIVVPGVLAVAVAVAGDWPQFRCDAGRSAAAPDELPAVLHLQWTRQYAAPRPVFQGEVRLQFDTSYEPVVVGKTIFIPSMVTDSVIALDTDTGEQRWQFFAEGPIRLAPVASGKRVFFVSDDGHLYCIDSATGQLVWKFHGLPPGKRERKILGNQRLISLWPAWGGPVLHDGVVYFGCGLWSAYQVCIHAVAADTGRVVWTSADSNHISRGNMDHGIANEAGLTPQGYLAVVNGKLVVPCGAQLPAFLDLKTGAVETYCMGWGGRNGLPKGTWFVAGTSHYLSHGGDLYDIARANDELPPDPRFPLDFKRKLYPGAYTRLKIDRLNQKDLGEFCQPVFDGTVMYDNEQGVTACDLADLEMQDGTKAELPAYRRTDTYPDRWNAAFRPRWKLPTDRRLHIKAGSQLYLGGPGAVEAVRVPASGEEPRVVWQAKIEGTPQRLVAADGKLFVVTREGRLIAFGGQEKAEPVLPAPAATDAPPADVWTRTAADILQTAKVRNGLALVLGLDSGRLVEELLRQSDLFVIAVGRDSARVAELRERLHRAGVYGSRASVHVGDPLSYPLPPYLASLISSEDWAAASWPGTERPANASPAQQKILAAVWPRLRPYGGTACLAVPVSEREAFVKRLADAGFADAAQRQVGDWLLVSRDGPLPGSADWSHAEADAAATGASGDGFVRAPLELLWFDTPRRRDRTPGATLVRVCGGRMLIKDARLQAIDVYTGRALWEASLPFAHKLTDQMVALEDALYVTGGTTCLVVDPTTGRKTAQFDLPAGLSGPWLNLCIWQSYLVAQSGSHVLCVNRQTGQLVWKFHGGQPALSLAVGGGKVFCAQLVGKPPAGTSREMAVTHALDIESGKSLWQVTGAGEVRYCPALDLVVTCQGIHRADDGRVVAALPEPPRPNPLIKNPPIPKPLLVVGQTLFFGTAEQLTMFDLATGAPHETPLAWTRRGCTIPRGSSNLITTRFRGNAACIDLASREVVPLWNVRAACSNNLFPADGVLNVPSLTGGCTCNYMPVSQAFVHATALPRPTIGP